LWQLLEYIELAAGLVAGDNVRRVALGNRILIQVAVSYSRFDSNPDRDHILSRLDREFEWGLLGPMFRGMAVPQL